MLSLQGPAASVMFPNVSPAACQEALRFLARVLFRMLPRFVPRILGQMLGEELWVWKELRCPTAFCGSPRNGHAVNVDGWNADRVVYSFGVGKDLSFETDLITRTGCKVHVFDPDPDVESWVRSCDLPPELHFHRWGLADRDGTERFDLRVRMGWWRTAGGRPERRGLRSYRADVYCLETIQRKLGHPHLDLLRIDIGGHEYSVLRDLFRHGAPFDQLLVEFHHRHLQLDPAETREVLNGLWADGFRVFSIDAGGREFGLLRTA